MLVVNQVREMRIREDVSSVLQYLLDVSAVCHETVLCVEHFHGDEAQSLPDLRGFD